MDSTQAKALSDSLLGKTVGGWQIEKLYGYGKSAVVMAARKNSVDGAVKVFHGELIERFGKEVQLDRISRERSLIGAEHPNLVRILDGGECTETGHLYVVMEPIAQPNLKECLTTVPEEAIPRLVAQIASAARFLADRNLVHRDIKPENIAVSEDFTKAILLDLGVVRFFGAADLTDVDARPFIGTLRYSSPEFLRREEQDTEQGWRALTFYQIGAVLHDLLMRQVLFGDVSEPYALLVKAVESSIPKVNGSDSRLVSLAKHCLVKKPETRLELVNWTDFQEVSLPDGSAALEMKERIKKFQKYHLSVSTPVAPVGNRLAVRMALIDFCNRFESRIASLLNDAQCFPLRETKSEIDPDTSKALTTVNFDKDERLGLSTRLTLVFEVVLTDFNLDTPIFIARASAAISNIDPTFEQMQPTQVFASGETPEILDGGAIENQFMQALMRVYELQATGLTLSGNEVCRLPAGK
ncbi:MAG: hypothetical protein C0434_02485 [Xanthomonadaceae bacterium]|nr:hypothetical protein [Xanthomonadaceae bacterium]